MLWIQWSKRPIPLFKAWIIPLSRISPERQYLYQGQTPQTFKMKDFLALYHDLSDQQKEVLTDACKIFVINGKKVALAKGEYSNIKITTITDLKIARGMIEDN